MADLRKVTYCGLYCGLCSMGGRIPEQARALRDTLKAEGCVTMLADGERMREVGLEKWIEEQEERRATGFAYADIRCHPYEVPDK